MKHPRTSTSCINLALAFVFSFAGTAVGVRPLSEQGFSDDSVDAAALHFYVSPSGSDENPGTAARPVASLRRASELVRASGAAGRRPITIHLARGTYFLTATLRLGPAHSGSRDAPVTWLGSGGETVVSGAVPLGRLAWKPYRNGIFQARVPPERIARLERFDQLYVNGRRQPLARYPNYDENAKYFNGTAADAVSPERTARWAEPAGGYLFAMHRNMWGDMAFRITGKDETGWVKIEGGWQNNRPTAPDRRYRYVENIFEELDAPGEWFYDKDTSVLYYYRPQDIDLSNARMLAAGLRSLMEIRGSQHEPVTDVRFKNMTFSHSLRTFMDNREPLLRSDWCIYRGSALLFEGTERCVVSDCDLAELGGNAIMFSKYNRNCRVSGCLIREIGSSGVVFVGDPNAVRSARFQYDQRNRLAELDTTPGPKTENYPADCSVRDCLITRTGRTEKQTAPVQISMSARITVSHCSIYDVPRAGINISEGTWGGHLVEFCDVFDTVKESGDHGSFNSWGRDRYWHVIGLEDDKLGLGEYAEMPLWDARETTTLRNNRWRCDHGWDIDLDDGSTNYHIYNNLCLNGGIKNREGFYRVVENNIMVNNSFHPHVWYRNSHDVFRRNIVFGPYRPVRMPRPWGKEIDYNLLHVPGLSDARPAGELQQLTGRDVHSVAADAMFIDPENGDYRVREGSPALELGFENFPMDRFGVESARLRAIARTAELPERVISAAGGDAGRAPEAIDSAHVQR